MSSGERRDVIQVVPLFARSDLFANAIQRYALGRILFNIDKKKNISTEKKKINMSKGSGDMFILLLGALSAFKMHVPR